MAGIWWCTDGASPTPFLDVVSHRGANAAIADQDSLIAFDGRIDNRVELQRQLGESSSDATLAAAAVREWGRDAVHYINGPFAIVMRDASGNIIAARDRFGLRPLYISTTSDGVAIASEMKQFFAGGLVAPKLDRAATLDFLVDGVTEQSTATLFAGVVRVPPASLVEIDVLEPAKPPEIHQWYSLPAPNSLELDEGQAVEAFRDALIRAVLAHAEPKTNRALCLSGGIDSSSIAVILGRYGDGVSDVFKASFCDDEYDDWRLFDSVLEGNAARPHVVTCTLADAIETVDALVWHLDQPFSHATLGAQWRLFAAASARGIESLVDGQGADEQLGGYVSMLNTHEAYLRGDAQRPHDPSRRAPLRPGAENGYPWLARPLREQMAARNDHARPAPRPLGELCRDRMHRGDLPMMMRDNDRIGAAFGIETHVPFLDRGVVELSIALGDRHKYVDGWSKYILRRALGTLLPAAVREHRGKASYSELEEKWIRRDSVPVVTRALESSRAFSGIFDADGVEEICSDITRAGKASVLLLWRIITFAAWAHRFGVRT